MEVIIKMASFLSPLAGLSRRMRLLAQECADFAYTLYLFTQDDFVTLAIPVVRPPYNPL